MADRRKIQKVKNAAQENRAVIRQAAGSTPMTREEQAEILRRGGIAVERRRQNRARRIDRSVKERQNAARHFSIRQSLVIGFSILMVAGAGFTYLYAYSGLHQAMNTVESRQEKLEQRISDNNAKKAEIDSSIDVDAIYQKALKMGMKVPSKDQVITYQKSEEDEASQSETVPAK